jgi:hypothetical protein
LLATHTHTHTHTHKWYLIDKHTDLHVSSNLAVANLGIQTLAFAKCLVSYDDLLPARLRRSYTAAEAAELAADQAEQISRMTADQTARPHTPETSCGDIIMPNTAPGGGGGESQEGTNIALAIRTPERLQGSPELIPTLASEPEGTLKLR